MRPPGSAGAGRGWRALTAAGGLSGLGAHRATPAALASPADGRAHAAAQKASDQPTEAQRPGGKSAEREVGPSLRRSMRRSHTRPASGRQRASAQPGDPARCRSFGDTGCCGSQALRDAGRCTPANSVHTRRRSLRTRRGARSSCCAVRAPSSDTWARRRCGSTRSALDGSPAGGLRPPRSCRNGGAAARPRERPGALGQQAGASLADLDRVAGRAGPNESIRLWAAVWLEML